MKKQLLDGALDLVLIPVLSTSRYSMADTGPSLIWVAELWVQYYQAFLVILTILLSLFCYSLLAPCCRSLWRQFTDNNVFWRTFGATCMALLLCILLPLTVAWFVCSGAQSWSITTSPSRLASSYPPIPMVPPVQCPDGRSNDCHAPTVYKHIERGVVDCSMRALIQREWVRDETIPGSQMIARSLSAEWEAAQRALDVHHDSLRLYVDKEADVNMAMHRALQLFAELSWSRNVPTSYAEQQLGHATWNGSSIILGLNNSMSTMLRATMRTTFVANQHWNKDVFFLKCWYNLHHRCKVGDILPTNQHDFKMMFERAQNRKQSWNTFATDAFDRYLKEESRVLDHLDREQRGICAAAEVEARKRRNGEHYLATEPRLSSVTQGTVPLIEFQYAEAVWYIGRLIRGPARIAAVDPPDPDTWFGDDKEHASKKKSKL